ncbi:MAG: nucleoside triphosphate pyrophosphatase [Rhodocyclaceae bacterium]
MPPALVLASTSRYRRELLERLRLPFATARPEVDESVAAGEAPRATAERLACAKARAVAPAHPDALVIGSDQVAHCGATIYGKPGDATGAIAQLRALSGRTVIFDTALCLLEAATGRCRVRTVPTEVRMRTLAEAEIERYVALEQPFDCAGAARSEGLGISLIESLRGDDPTALIGLPLIALCAMLREAGVALP